MTMTPAGAATYSGIALKGNGGSAALGLDILAGAGAAYLSADNHVWRNAAQAVQYAALSSTGLAVTGTITATGAISAAGATQTGPVKIRYYNNTKISNGHIQLTENTGDPYWQMNIGLYTDGAAYNGTIDVLHGKLFLQPSGQLTQVDGALTVVGALTASGGLTVTGTITATGGFAPVVQVAGADSITPTFANDIVERLAATGAITLNNPTGTAVNGAGVVIRLRSPGAQAISYGSQYRGIGTNLPTATIGAKLLIIGMIYNSTDVKWDVVSVAQEA
jgi:hypothetical protein